MDRMGHILELAKALATNPETMKVKYPEDKIAENATKIYDNIEELELKRLRSEVNSFSS